MFLPEDIWLNIISYLDLQDIYNITLTSKSYLYLFFNDYLWLDYVNRNYPKLRGTIEKIHNLSYKDICRLLVYFKEINKYYSEEGINPYVLQGINYVTHDPKISQSVMTDIMMLYIKSMKKKVTKENLMFYMRYPEVFKLLIGITQVVILKDYKVLNHAIDNNDIPIIKLILERIPIIKKDTKSFVSDDQNPLLKSIKCWKHKIFDIILESNKVMTVSSCFYHYLSKAFFYDNEHAVSELIKHKYFHPDLIGASILNVNFLIEHLDILVKVLDHPGFVEKVGILGMLLKYACRDENSKLFKLLVNHPNVDTSFGSKYFLKRDINVDYIFNNELGSKNIYRLVHPAVVYGKVNVMERLILSPNINFDIINLETILSDMTSDNHIGFEMLLSKKSSIHQGNLMELCLDKPKCMEAIFKSFGLIPIIKSSFISELCKNGHFKTLRVLIKHGFKSSFLSFEHFNMAVKNRNQDMAIEIYKLEHIKDAVGNYYIILDAIELNLPKLLKVLLKTNSCKEKHLKYEILNLKKYWSSDVFYILLKYSNLDLSKYANEYIYVAAKNSNIKLIKYLLTNRKYNIRRNKFLDFCDEFKYQGLDIYVRDVIYNKIRYNIKSQLDGEYKTMMKRILNKLKSILDENKYSIIKATRRIALYINSYEPGYEFCHYGDTVRNQSLFRLELESIEFRKHEVVCREIMGNSLYEIYAGKTYGLEYVIYRDAHNLNYLGARNIIHMIKNGTIDMKQDITMDNIRDILKVPVCTIKGLEELDIKYRYAVNLLNRYKN